MSVSVVIVNWNAGHQLRECIESLIGDESSTIDSIIVVDNGSTDGSADELGDLPEVRVIAAGGNLGFSRACNLGARVAEGDFFLFLNPDTRVFPETLPVAVDYMSQEANRGVGICGVQLYDENGQLSRSCARFPDMTSLIFGVTGLVRLFPRFGHFMTEWDHGQTQTVDQVIGAFFLVRKELFLALGGFDERFFVYFEEVDFTRRAYLVGSRSTYLAEAKAFHAGGGTSKQVKAMRLFYFLRSRLLYFAKHFGKTAQLAALMLTLFVEPLARTIQGLIRRDIASVRETWSAFGMLMTWLPRWWLKGVTR